MTSALKPRFNLSALAKWWGRRIDGAVSKNRGRYVFLSPPHAPVQRVRNRDTGAVSRFRIRHKNDFWVGRQIYEREEYDITKLRREADIRARYEAILASGYIPLILDCGGNIGLAAKYLAEHFPAARVVSVEPSEENFSQLTANCDCPRIIPVQAAIASEPARGRLIGDVRASDGFQVEEDPDGDVTFVTIDELIRDHGEGCLPFILKIDIEGFESDLFSQNYQGWIDAFYMLAIEFHDWMMPGEARSGNFLRAIAPLGRDFVCISETVFSISNAPPEAVDAIRNQARASAES